MPSLSAAQREAIAQAVVDPLRRHLCFTNADASTPQVAWITDAVWGVVEAWIMEARREERERIAAAVTDRWQESERVPVSAVLNLIDRKGT
jgi:hypothetical protein